MTAREILDSYMKELEANQPRLTEGHAAEIKRLRRAAFYEHVRSMAIPAELRTWAQVMRGRHGNRLNVWGVEYNSYLVALMIVRYGEAIESWPAAFSADDLRRATDWRDGTGRGVNGVTFPDVEEYGGDNPDSGLSGGALKAIVSVAVLFMLAALWMTDAGGFWYGVPFVLFGTAMTDFLENKIIDHLFRTTSYAKPTVLAVALFTAAPGETGGGTEVTGGSYARVSNNPLNANWVGTHGTTTGDSSGTGGVTSNAGILTFPTPSANWGVITHQAIFDAASAGNMLIYSALTVSKTVNNGDPAPTFAASALTVTAA